MLFILYWFVDVMAQSDCEPKYTNFYPIQQQIANFNVSDAISGFNYSLINPPNGTTILQSGQLLFSQAIQEDIQQVLFASILQTAEEQQIIEQISSLVQINNTSYQVLVVNKYQNQTHSSQLYSTFNSDYQCLSIRQMKLDFMIINCLQNQLVTIYQGNVQTSILPNITSNNYPSQIEVSRILNQLIVIFPYNLNVSLVFQINISSTNIVEYTMISQTIYSGIIYNTQILFDQQFILTSEELVNIYEINSSLTISSMSIQNCYYFDIYQNPNYEYDIRQIQTKIMILCQNNIQEYYFLQSMSYFFFVKNITQPFTYKFSTIQNYLPLQFNREYMILQQDQNYIIYDLILNKINFNSINNQSLFLLINPYTTTYFLLSITDQQILSLQKPLLVINQLEYSLSNTSIEILLYRTLNISCQIIFNIIPSINNAIYQKNQQLKTQQTTQSFPIIMEMNDYIIGSNISFTIQNSQNVFNFYALQCYLINKTNSNLQYNQIMDSEVIFVQNEFLSQSTYLVFVQYKNLTFVSYSCSVSQNNYEYYHVLLLCQQQAFFIFSDQVQILQMINYYFNCRDCFYIGFQFQVIYFVFGQKRIFYTFQSPVQQIQAGGPLLYVMQQDVISVFNLLSETNTEIYNISNITPTQIIVNQDLYTSLLFINNQTQLLIYNCQLSQAYLIKSINISILNPTIILAQKYLYISNSTMQETFYIYNLLSIQLISQEFGNYAGQYYFNPILKFYAKFSSDNVLSIFQNSGQNNQLFRTIQQNSSIDQVSLTYFDKFIVINFLQNKAVFTYLIDQYQTLFLIPELLNYDQITVNYQINASNEFSFSMLSSQLIVENSGVVIFDNSYDPLQFYQTKDDQNFQLDPSLLKGQISNYQLNCFECEKYNVTQQYHINDFQCSNIYGLVTMAYIEDKNQIAFSANVSGALFLYNISQPQCELLSQYQDACYSQQYLYYFSNLNILISICSSQYSFSFYQIVNLENSQNVQYNIQQYLTNVQVVDQFNAAFIQQNQQIKLYQITLAEIIFEQSITTQSQIISYTVGGINFTDDGYMVLMYLTEDQSLFINLYSVALSHNYYNYTFSNTTSIPISNLMEKYLIDGIDVYDIQIVQIIMNNQYIVSIQTIITTQYYYSFSININILVGSTDQFTTQLQCLIPPYGNWGKLNQISGNNQTLILIYKQEQQTLIALYDLNNCQNQNTLNFSIGIPDVFFNQLNVLLYSIQPNADLFQSILLVSSQNLQYYSFTNDIEITIESSKNMNPNQSIYLITSNHFMQYNMSLYLIEDVHIMAWWAWVLISFGIVLIVSATTFLIIRRKRQKKQLLEIK